LVGEAVHALAFAIAAVSATIDPMVIVIGGSLGLAQRGVVNRAVRAARLLCINEGGVGPRAVPASLGGESVLAGAALLGQDAAGTLR
jgi:predicted NBD/HSP70 family sugar kinase